MGAEYTPRTFWKSLAGSLAQLETLVLCLLLAAMVLLACLQIVLRTFFGGGLLWVEPLLRYFVLWSGLLGAALATSRGSHIAIDLADYLIGDQLKPLVKLLCSLFSAVTAGVLTWASILFIRSEFEFGGEALFNIPSWCWNSIFPIAFTLITLRYIALSAELTKNLLRREGSSPQGGVQ